MRIYVWKAPALLRPILKKLFRCSEESAERKV